MFLVFSSGTESIWSSPVFTFFLTVVHFYFRFQSLLFRGVSFEVSNVFMAVISDEHR
jgi:hypothetical protein